MSQVIASTYEIIKRLGAGGGGNVYLARHLRLKKKVVLKIDKRKLSASKEFLRREVDILKELSHPYIPGVYDFFVEGEEVYTVMDYIEGESLDKALKRGERFSQAQVVGWACQLLDALCYLHSPVHGDPPKGFVHSDIKPANLMLTPEGNVCLIDFNIALALGEEGVIGCSAGYASPEHYGLDFSSRYEEENDSRMDERMLDAAGTDDTDLTLTMLPEEATPTVTMAGVSASQGFSRGLDLSKVQDLSRARGSFSMSGSASSSGKRMVTPDVRSDIYSVGATLYHLLSGRRPSRNAKEVVRLSKDSFSPGLVRIITKAMDPNPDLRYQTAKEMMQDFQNLRVNDPRMRRWKKHRRMAAVIFPTLFFAGGLAAFVGLKGMQLTDRWLKLTEYAQTALDQGDVEEAIDHSMKVLSESSDRFMPKHVSGVQKVLTEAVGVYDLSDGYKAYKMMELPSAPHYMAVAPDGKSVSALCGQKVIIFDTVGAKISAELPAGPFAISQIWYLDNHTILYSGQGGVKAYDIKKNRELWTGGDAASICVSGNGKTAAGIGEGDTFATVYDTKTGTVKCKVDFGGNSQNIGIKDNLLALNENGSLLGVSFRDGSLKIYNLRQSGADGLPDELTIFGADSGYTHFEGGFYGQYLAFAASDQEKSTFAVVDAVMGEECGGFQGETDFRVQADEDGIYVQSDHILVRVDPVTGEQKPLVTMDENILRFAKDGEQTLVTSGKGIYFFDKDAQMTSHYKKEYLSDLVGIAGGTAVIGSMDKPVVRIMVYEENPEAEMFSYDPGYQHDEARISADGKTVMLFSYRQFRIYDTAGNLINETDIPDADQVIDQQFIRDGEESRLEVIYGNGKTRIYSADDGSLLRGEAGTELSEKAEDLGKRNEEGKAAAGNEAGHELDEEFIVGNLRIKSPLDGTPTVYDVKTGKEVARLKADTHLTYVTEAGDYLVAQYMAVDGNSCGQLLDKNLEVLAELLYLCDVVGETLIFDYPTGSIRKSKIYELNEITEKSKAR